MRKTDLVVHRFALFADVGIMVPSSPPGRCTSEKYSMMTIDTTTTDDLTREAQDASALEFLALLLQVPATDRDEVFAELAAISARATH